MNLATAIVLATTEDECTLVGDEGPQVAGYLPQFPAPRTERVLPAHLAAVLTAPDGERTVVWRWYDAVVVADGDLVALWEPAHGIVHARRRQADQRYRLGSRAYASAGLPGADWWVAGPVAAQPEVELDELATFLTELGLS